MKTQTDAERFARNTSDALSYCKQHFQRLARESRQEEFENWRSQFVTSNSDKMGLRYKPMAFTEQGVEIR